MALCVTNTVEIRECEYFSSLNALKFDLVNSKSQEIQNFLLLYRKQNCNILQSVDFFKYILASYKIDMSFGDFKIKYYNDNHASSTTKTFNRIS